MIFWIEYYERLAAGNLIHGLLNIVNVNKVELFWRKWASVYSIKVQTVLNLARVGELWIFDWQNWGVTHRSIKCIGLAEYLNMLFHLRKYKTIIIWEKKHRWQCFHHVNIFKTLMYEKLNSKNKIIASSSNIQKASQTYQELLSLYVLFP